MRESFSVGGALGRGFGIFFSNLVPFVLMTAIAFIPMIVVSFAWNPFAELTRESLERSALIYGGITLLTTLILQPLATAAVTFGVVETMNGRKPSIGRCLTVGLRRMFPVLGVVLLTGLLAVLGVLALIVGVVVVVCILYVAVPANVIEQSGVMRALSRSAFLTKGNRWGIFGLLVILGIIGSVANKVVESATWKPESATSLADLMSKWHTYVGVSAGVQIVLGALGATMCAVTYVMLRNEKDGVGVGELARVFE